MNGEYLVLTLMNTSGPMRSHLGVSGSFFAEAKGKSARNKTLIMLHIYLLIFHLIQLSVSTKEHEWIKIPCPANIEQGVKYRKISWYKVEEGSDVLTGLVLKDLLKNTTILYKFANHSYEVGEDNSLLVPGSAEVGCAIYRCTLWPPLGHYIQEANTEYDSADCIKPQLQAVRCKQHDQRFKFIIIPCVLMACAAVIMFLNIKMIKKRKENGSIMKKLVQTDESI